MTPSEQSGEGAAADTEVSKAKETETTTTETTSTEEKSDEAVDGQKSESSDEATAPAEQAAS